MDRAVFMEISSIANLRLAATLAAVERYRLANRKRPETLADLVPTYFNTVPEDPFDGKPLRYKKLAQGYIVYSVAQNQTDEGGKEDTKEGKPMREPDIVFTMNR